MADEKKILLSVKVDVEQALKNMADIKSQIDGLKGKQKELDRSTDDGRRQYEAYGTQLRQLNSTYKEQQKNYDNAIKAEQAQKESLNQLKAQLSLLTAEYNKLSKEQRNSAEGTALQKNIKGISDELKKAEAGLGNFTRNVGDYKNSIKDVLGLNSGFAGMLTKTAEGAKEAGTSFGKQGVEGVKSFGKSLLSLLANPIVAIIAAIAAVIMLVVEAIKSNGAATNALNQILAPFKNLVELVMTAIGKLVAFLLQGVVALEQWANSIMALIPGLDKLAEKNKEAIALEQEKQALSRKNRENQIQDSKDELSIAELKNKSKQKDKYSIQDRLKFLQQADAMELSMSQRKSDFATEKLNERLKEMKLEGKAYKDLTSDEKDALTQLYVNVNNAKKEYFEGTLRIKSQEANLIAQYEQEQKQKQQEAQQRAREAQQKAEELSNRIAKANNDLNSLLLSSQIKSLKETSENENKSYMDRFNAISVYSEKQKQLIDDNSNFEKKQKGLTKSEIKLIEEKAKQDKIDIENETNKQIIALDKQVEEKKKAEITKQLENFKKGNEQQTIESKKSYQNELTELVKNYDKGKITSEQYLSEKNKLLKKYEEKDFNQTLDNLQKQINVKGLSEQQKFDIQKAIDEKRLEHQQKINDEIVNATKERADKEKAIEEKLSEVKKQLYSQLQQTIQDITNGYFESRLQDLEIETKSVSDNATKQKEAIETKENAGTISKANAEKQKKAIDAQAKKDTDKLEAEKKKVTREQAIFNRVVSVFNIGLSTAEAIMKAVAEFPITGGMPFAAIAGGIGALQIASIMAQPLPKASLGMLLRGKSHALGGIPIEAEGGESIINKRSTSMFTPLLSAINQAGGGVPFVPNSKTLTDGGYSMRTYYDSPELKEYAIKQAMKEAVQELKIYTAVEDIRKEDKKYTEIEQNANF